MMSRDDAEGRWAGLIGGHAGITFDEAFAHLERARVVINGQIDMGALSRAVLEQRQELTMQNTNKGGLYVSTIHRSKGLEFDEVYLLDPSGNRATWQGNPEEVRVVYVAATRAKTQLTILRADAKALGMGPRAWKTPVKFHPHEFDSGTGRHRLFLDGLGELESDSLLEDMGEVPGSTFAQRIVARQEALWNHHAEGGRTLDACFINQRLVFVVPGPGGTRIPICLANASLAGDVLGLGWTNRLVMSGIVETPLFSLATLAYPIDDDEATDYLGSGRLVMAPVLRGWGTVG